MRPIKSSHSNVQLTAIILGLLWLPMMAAAPSAGGGSSGREQGRTDIEQIPGDAANVSIVTQTGSGNSASVSQQAYLAGGGRGQDNKGQEDRERALETGLIRNWAKIYQNGYLNDATISQSGTDNAAEVDQTGSINTAKIDQTGSGHEAKIEQDGTGHRADIQQFGLGREFDIVQTGSQKSIQIREYGGDGWSPAISIVQH